jgi:predicted transcriptional regulator
LVEKDLIEYLQGERTYKTTEKGMRLLRIFTEMRALIDTRQKEENTIIINY